MNKAFTLMMQSMMMGMMMPMMRRALNATSPPPLHNREIH